MQSHGKLTLEWEGNVLVVTPQGPFNEEGAIEGITTLKETVLTTKVEKWTRLELWEENTLGSPTVIDYVRESYLWCVEHGCSATAIVVKNNFQHSLIEKYFTNNIGVFQNKRDAMDWLVNNDNA
ncbi:MAG: hypothetical protein OQK09_16900 [Colwellia sp.]|nr:hypothetical protein [Colwellia sp.]MCW8865653.1 hypothetical protein [Colwellia sp.]MCW9083188.1 hypothetical protein [Colwellia sp.]